MVNKAVVGVIGVILITTLGVGALVGLQGGGTPADDPANGNDGNGGTQGTAPTATPNGTSGNDSFPTDTGERSPIPASEFNRAEIESHIGDGINEWRESEGLGPLRRSGTTANRLTSMARDLSTKMANEGTVSHVIDGVGTSERYNNNDMFDTCQYQTVEGYIAQPGKEGGRNVQFEHVTSTIAGGTYQTDEGVRFNEDDAAVARAIVDQLKDQAGDPKGILKEGVTKMGVGVEITRTGGVYATVHLCGG